VDLVFSLIRSARANGEIREAILSIIMEKAEAFFQGQKPLDVVADIIQSRAQLYVSENK